MTKHNPIFLHKYIVLVLHCLHHICLCHQTTWCRDIPDAPTTRPQKAKILELKFAWKTISQILREMRKIWPEKCAKLTYMTVKLWYNRSDDSLKTGEITRKVSIFQLWNLFLKIYQNISLSLSSSYDSTISIFYQKQA